MGVISSIKVVSLVFTLVSNLVSNYEPYLIM